MEKNYAYLIYLKIYLLSSAQSHELSDALMRSWCARQRHVHIVSNALK